ncbi:MAG TPA: response regulator [Vicinamibacterales bacterium]
MSTRVLLVEDDRFLRRAAEAMLRRHGYDVRTAADGEEGLRLALSDPPDVVLLDLVMPRLPGLEVLVALRADARTARVPVIVLTNLGEDADIERARRAGATAYFIKANTSLASLVTRVQDVLASRAA